MKKIDLLNPEINRIIMECEDRILELIDNRDECRSPRPLTQTVAI